MPSLIQPSFAKGEISPTLYGRTDTALYQIALRKVYNMFVRPYGGISKRPGLQYIGPAGSHSAAPRLIEFHFGSSDQYILEFGNLYMRVIRNDGHVTDTSTTITGVTKANPGVVTAASHGLSNGDEVYISGVGGMTELNGRHFLVANKTANTFELTSQVTGSNVNTTSYTTFTSGGTVARIYKLTTPYTSADLAELKYVQSNDVMTLVHKDYAPRTLSRTSHSSWTLAAITTNPVTSAPTGITVTAQEVGDKRARYTVTAIDTDESLPGISGTAVSVSGATKANPCVITANSHGFQNEDLVYLTGLGGMTELNGRYFRIYDKATNTFKLRDEDSTNYTTYTSGGSAYQTFDEVTLANITAISKASQAIISVSAGHDFQIGDTVKIDDVGGMTEINDKRLAVTNVQADTDITVSIDSTGFTTYTSGGAVWRDNSAYNTITWTAVSGAKRYVVYKESNGLFGKIGETEALTFIDNNHFVDLSITPPQQNLPFRSTTDYPGAVGYWEQRKVFGGTIDDPDTSWYTRVGTESNLTSSIPTQDDDAIEATLTAREVNEIRWYIPQNDLLVFTNSSEWKVNSGPDSAFGPATIRQKLQSQWGCSHLRPIVAGQTVLFLEENSAAVRTLGYSLTLDGYTGTEVSILAEHLLRNNTITAWAWSHSPDGRVYMVRDDGKLLTLTYNQEQEVVAWSSCETDGWFKDVAALRHDSSDIEGSVYFAVKRSINGTTTYTIEKLLSLSAEHLHDMKYLDCMLSLDSPVNITGSTAANPVVITAPSHGFSNGDEVDISGIIWAPTEDAYGNLTQPTQLNGNRYTVANKTANTFELSGVNGSAYNAYVEGGEVRKAVTSITGLWHLEGETVTVVANGTVIEDQTVATGGLTLASKASRVHVGLPYMAEIETLDIEAPSAGTMQGREKTIAEAVVRVDRSRGMIIGPDDDRMVPVRDTEFTGDAVDGLLTGDIEVKLKTRWNSNGRIKVRQPDPLPLNILAVIPEMTMEDNND